MGTERDDVLYSGTYDSPDGYDLVLMANLLHTRIGIGTSGVDNLIVCLYSDSCH